MKDELLTDGILYLRAPEPDDIDIMYLWENDTRLWNFGTTTAPYSRKNIQDYVNSYDPDIWNVRQLRLMICLCSSGRPVGIADLYDFDPANLRSAVGILIAESDRRKGYAYGALSLLEGYCRLSLGIHQLWALIDKENEASRRLFDKAEFKIGGCLRSWIRKTTSYSDAYFYQKLLI